VDALGLKPNTTVTANADPEGTPTAASALRGAPCVQNPLNVANSSTGARSDRSLFTGCNVSA
jgi:hypothetical protein